MGVSNSKSETCEPLRLCKERKRYMKEAVDCRYNLAAAHVVYVGSLHNVGMALSKFAESESSSNANANKVVYVDDVELSPLTTSPQPLPRLSWDYFNPSDGSFRLMRHGMDVKETTSTNSKEQKDVTDEEEETEIIPHRPNHFLSSIKHIESYFIRASKLGTEISNMLEANKIQISYSDAKGSSTTGTSSSLLTCFKGESTLVLHEPAAAKVITWKRSTSCSNSSALGPPSDDFEDNKNNYINEYCMMAGSHSSTLDRLYAWERKLYDEVKASERVRKAYERTCGELRNQFAKDVKPHIIDKTRGVAKDLHSRMKVALHTVDSISKRIEKMRDQELQPQLMELIQGLMRMWKSMHECHHAQHITISSANPSTTRRSHSKNHVIRVELEHELECFRSSFCEVVKSYTSYVDSINNWLQNCIIQPKERVKGRRGGFCPRRAVAPLIFIMCRDWSARIATMPSQKLADAIKEFCFLISVEEEMKTKELSLIENREEKNSLDFSMIQVSLTKLLERLTNYCEDSVKMYEEIIDTSETAGKLYSNYRPAPPRPPSSSNI